MELIRYNSGNTQIRNTKPSIRIAWGGLMLLNKPAALIMGVVDGTVDLYQDKNKPKDWYIAPGKDNKSFIVKTRKGGSHYSFSSRHLAQKLIKDCGYEVGTSHTFPIALQGTTDGTLNMCAIITSAGKKKELCY